MKAVLTLIMRIARRLFRNTPVQRLGLTTFIYKKIAIRAFGTDPVEVDFRGAKLLYPGGDYTTLPTLVAGSYEETELNHLLQTLDALDRQIIALDIGANVGIWTVLLARHPNVARVISFEPSPQNLTYLKHNIQSNKVEHKVQIIEAAASNEEGTSFFDDEGSGATMRLAEQGRLSVSTVIVDKVVQSDEVGLIKIDVEGFEPTVLAGCWRTIEQNRPILYIEFSLSQSKSAGNSWYPAGPKLLDLYGTIVVIGDREQTPIKNFSELDNDQRLLNLFLS